MSALEAAQLANLILVGILCGNDFGTEIVIHPMLNSVLPVTENFRVRRALIHRYGYVMVWLSPLSFASGIVVAALISDRSSVAFGLAVAGTVALGVWQFIAFRLGPTNRRIIDASDDVAPDDWLALRQRWDRLHSVRVPFAVLAFCLFVPSALLA